ncbi:MAG TPA: hypothetical protein VFM13_13570 [Gaiellaceae bacterium]|nr:hypothetical protein [Gaiellaceae bacterium]
MSQPERPGTSTPLRSAVRTRLKEAGMYVGGGVLLLILLIILLVWLF